LRRAERLEAVGRASQPVTDLVLGVWP